jgi:hypothetical protein
LILLAVGYFILRYLSSSDEPPIFVKRGTIEIELLTTANVSWQQGADWSHNGTSAQTDEYYLKLVTLAGFTCPTALDPTSRWKDVTVTYSDGQVVRLKRAGNKTHVKADRALQPASPKKLVYVGAGDASQYISKLELKNGGNTWECSFPEKLQFDSVTLCSLPINCP